MPNIPRDLTGSELAKILNHFGYIVTRQTGSHLRLTSRHRGIEHHITIPNHDTIKIGTLNNILNGVALYLIIDKQWLIKELFRKDK